MRLSGRCIFCAVKLIFTAHKQYQAFITNAIANLKGIIYNAIKKFEKNKSNKRRVVD